MGLFQTPARASTWQSPQPAACGSNCPGGRYEAVVQIAMRHRKVDAAAIAWQRAHKLGRGEGGGVRRPGIGRYEARESPNLR